MAGAIYLWELKGEAVAAPLLHYQMSYVKNNGSVCKQDTRFASPRLLEMQKKKTTCLGKQPLTRCQHLSGLEEIWLSANLLMFQNWKISNCYLFNSGDPLSGGMSHLNAVVALLQWDIWLLQDRIVFLHVTAFQTQQEASFASFQERKLREGLPRKCKKKEILPNYFLVNSAFTKCQLQMTHTACSLISVTHTYGNATLGKLMSEKLSYREGKFRLSSCV